MNKNLLLIALGLTVFNSAYAQQRDCFHMNQTRFDRNYERCINEQFQLIKDELGTNRITRCFNRFINDIEPRYIYCINSNFRNIGIETGTFPSLCRNRPPLISHGFESCVNTNFFRIFLNIGN